MCPLITDPDSKIIRSKNERLFGRRKGRPLRAGRTILMDELLPKIEITVPETGKIVPQELFDFPLRELWMEVGFGGGEHLAAQAQANPDIGCFGCEPFINGVASMLAHIDKQNLKNIRLYADDARHILDAMPESCLNRCYVLFADPWPKTRHAFRRFIGKENLDRLARVMKTGGDLFLATDVTSLAEWMRERADEHSSFERHYDSAVPPENWVPTRYEQKGRAAGRQSVYMIYKKK